MEWLIIVGVLGLGGYLWGQYSEGKSKHPNNQNRQSIDAYKRLQSQTAAPPPKLNVERADVESVKLSVEQRKVYDLLENT